MKEALSGVIDKVVFHNPENGFAVLRVEVRGRRGLVTVVGQVPRAVAGEFLEAAGTWVQDPEHGPQFKADELRTAAPQTRAGIEKFLGSGLVKGIGGHFARKIVDVFGERTLQVIDESPAFLKEVKGIGPRRIQRIRESWRAQKAVRDILVFLQSHGLGTNRAVRIYKTYGDRAIDLLRTNPYRLADDIWGIGFQTADEFAARLGIERVSPLRARAALGHVLRRLSQDGHCAAPQSEVLQRGNQLTGIDVDVLREALEHQIQEQEIIREAWTSGVESHPPPAQEPWLYTRPLFRAEVGAAGGLRALADGTHPLPQIDLDAAIDWVEKRIGLTLAAQQREALRQACRQKVLVITGGPGVGKTTLVRAILEIFAAKGMRCLLCAPTGRAAKRLAETTGREAKTIHRLLEFEGASGKCRRDRHNPLELDLLVVDETSMVDIFLMSQLLRAVPPKACLVLVGDVDQLPSVGPGMVLADIIAADVVPVVRLTEIFRQAQASWIVRAAHRILHGELPESATAERPGDFYVIEAESPPVLLERIVTLVRDRIPERFRLGGLEIQVLTPMNRSELGTRNLNTILQNVLNPSQDESEVARFGWTFRQGDKVLQTINNYDKDVFNGDIGRVSRIDVEDQEIRVDFDGRSVTYDFDELDELNLAYALTIHKSQGSEYPAVIIPLHTQHYMMLQRNLLYTAVTRGKRLVVLVGSRRALSLAIGRQDTAGRFTALAWRLRRREKKLGPWGDLAGDVDSAEDPP